MAGPITIAHVARKLGVSKATVSVALRNRPGVSEKLRARIQQAATRLGYRSNPLVGIHMAHVRNNCKPRYVATLGWIDTYPTRKDFINIPIFNEFYLGACAQAARLGFKMEDFWLHEPEITAERLTRVLRTRNISGLLIGPQPFSGGKIDLAWEHFSPVTFGYSLIAPRLHLVANHHYRTMQDAFGRLDSFGYKRIGAVINLENNERVNRAWTSVSWDEHRRDANGRARPLLFHEIDNPLTPALFVEWFLRERPDAIIAHDYPQHIHEGLRRIGLQTGRDVAVALTAARDDDTFHAGMHQNGRLIGSAAVDYVVGMLHRNETGVPTVPQRLLVESTWKSGPSVDQNGPPDTPRE